MLEGLWPKRFLWTLCALGISAGSPRADIHPAEVLVLESSRNAESKLISRIYAALRQIPPENILVLDIPKSPTLSREDYREAIEKPLRTFLRSPDNFRIRYIVTTRGMPVRIGHDFSGTLRKTAAFYEDREASLESELMEVLRYPSSLSGWNSREPALPGLPENREFIVTRMDGPGIARIKQNLRASLDQEKSGAHGPVCIEWGSGPRPEGPARPYSESLEKLRVFSKFQAGDFDFYFADSSRTPVDSNLVVVSLGDATPPRCQLAEGGIEWAGSARSVSRGLPNYIPAGYGFMLVGESTPSAYPLPHEFLILLLSGRYALGEILNLVLPHSSWKLTFWGDPLYHPFRERPAFEADLIELLIRGESPNVKGKVKGKAP